MLTGAQGDITMVVIALLQTSVAPLIDCNKPFLTLSEKFQKFGSSLSYY
jgi:hypothetical protein